MGPPGVEPSALEPAALELAAAALAAGRVVGLPTDTVYGLAVDALRPGAADRLFALKARPRTVEVAVLVADAGQARALAGALPEEAEALMARWWPGALTLVLPRRPGLAADLGGDGSSVGVRCPDHGVARALAALVGPLATTSANRHGHPPVTTAAGLAEMFGDGVAVVLDGGLCQGPPSTVVALTGGEPRCLRDAALPWSEVAASLA